MTLCLAAQVTCGHWEEQGRQKLLLTSCLLIVFSPEFSEVEVTLGNHQGHGA